jgi:outer membrane protein OmpA-like peptidoglycan-associated protein
MINKKLTATLLACIVTAGVASAQTAPNPTQRAIDVSPNPVPIFRVTVVGHTTAAVNYRPRRGDTKIDFAGTALMPQATGSAGVSGEQGYIKISARFDKLVSPTRFGREYLTYVLWAITPEGRAANLGEVQFDNDDAKVEVTTEFQAFGLIVTAEPYFAVTQPSDVVVIENVIRADTTGTFEVIQAKHELLKRGTYLMTQDAAKLENLNYGPGATLDLAEARNAVMLARFAGADRYATETYDKAARLLADAEGARARQLDKNAVMMPARQAVQTAEDARLIGLKRQEEEFTASQGAAAAARERYALDRAQTEAARRRQAELTAQNATAAQGAAERGLANAGAAVAAADAARNAADAGRDAAEADRAKAEAARLAAEAKTRDAQSAAAQSEQDKAALRDKLRDQLNVVLDTRETARGLIVNLSDVLFDTGSANLKPGAREKLARISGILVTHPDLRLAVEGHTDSVGATDYNQQLSERRAQAVRVYLVDQKIGAETVGTAGFGEGQPVATNDTAAGRQQNRRVELVVSGDIIGRR